MPCPVNGKYEDITLSFTSLPTTHCTVLHCWL